MIEFFNFGFVTVLTQNVDMFVHPSAALGAEPFHLSDGTGIGAGVAPCGRDHILFQRVAPDGEIAVDGGAGGSHSITESIYSLRNSSLRIPCRSER